MVNILDLFSKEQLSKFKKRDDGCFVGACPSCGNGEGTDNYGGCIINPNTNTLFCFGNKTIFDFTETAFLLTGEIMCSEGRQKI